MKTFLSLGTLFAIFCNLAIFCEGMIGAMNGLTIKLKLGIKVQFTNLSAEFDISA